jgi:hypothetical protein
VNWYRRTVFRLRLIKRKADDQGVAVNDVQKRISSATVILRRAVSRKIAKKKSEFGKLNPVSSREEMILTNY